MSARLVQAPRAEPLGPHLPVVERESLSARNAACRRRAPLPCDTSLGPVAVERAASADLPAWEGAWTRIGFEAGGREGSLWLPRDIVTAALDRAYPGIDLAGLSPDERAFLVETVERSLLDGLAAATGTELRLAVAEDADAPPDDAMALVLRAGPEHAYPARLACHPVERDRLLRRFAAQPPQPDPIPDLMVPVVFRCGRTALSIEEFSLLEVGCGIAMDDTTLGFQKLVAVVAERYVQTCAWQTIKPTLEGPLLSRADPLTVLYTTNGFAMNDPDFQGAATGSVGEVPINLVFELGRTEVPVAGLETLQAGYVFDLSKPLSQSVDILANGRRVGSGELVRLGDSIGVRVTRLIR